MKIGRVFCPVIEKISETEDKSGSVPTRLKLKLPISPCVLIVIAPVPLSTVTPVGTVPPIVEGEAVYVNIGES